MECVRLRRTQTPVLERTLHMTQQVGRSKSSLFWGVVNAVVLAIILYDAINTCRLYSKTLIYFEWLLVIIFLLNTLYHFGRYLKVTFCMDPVILTPRQKKLMGIPDSDPHFRVPSSANISACSDLSSTPMNMSAISWRSSTPSDSMTSPNCTMSSPSWIYYRGSALSSPQQSPASQRSNVSSVEFIDNETSLSQYLRDYETFEKTSAVGQTVEQPTNLLSSFWNHPTSRTPTEVPVTLRRCAYQMAPPTTVASAVSPGTPVDETGVSSSFILQSQDVWRRVKVNPSVLTQWNANLRMWISQTILERLVREIDSVDETLQRHGLADVRVGLVGLERLKKTAQILQVAQNVPTLISLVSFLDLSPNQEYLVQRIRELAKGGCMSEFRWNSGGSFHNKEWEEHLPTDSAIVMHLFATYLDSQLPPLPQNPDGRPFTTQHFARTPDKPPRGKNTLAIYQMQINPPHYVLISGEDTLEVPKGRNNLLHTLLLFLHQVKTREHGMLGRVNLGPSGINLLWVLEI